MNQATTILTCSGTRTAVAVVTNLETKAMEAMQLGVRVLEAQRRAKGL